MHSCAYVSYCSQVTVWLNLEKAEMPESWIVECQLGKSFLKSFGSV